MRVIPWSNFENRILRLRENVEVFFVVVFNVLESEPRFQVFSYREQIKQKKKERKGSIQLVISVSMVTNQFACEWKCKSGSQEKVWELVKWEKVSWLLRFLFFLPSVVLLLDNCNLTINLPHFFHLIYLWCWLKFFPVDVVKSNTQF